jgi:hypothetical protein
MKNYTHYLFGLIIWSSFSTLILFAMVAIASQEMTLDYICIDTIRFILLLLVTNLLLNAVLIKLNNS